MIRVAQLGIILGALGIVLMLVGLFPGITGLPPTVGFGVVQILVILFGYALLIFGALLYVKFFFYAMQDLTLLQQIGIRLALTGLTFSVLAGLADVLGFGSNPRPAGEEIIFGPLQIWSLLGCFALASFGVIVFALAGEPELTDET